MRTLRRAGAARARKRRRALKKVIGRFPVWIAVRELPAGKGWHYLGRPKAKAMVPIRDAVFFRIPKKLGYSRPAPEPCQDTSRHTVSQYFCIKFLRQLAIILSTDSSRRCGLVVKRRNVDILARQKRFSTYPLVVDQW